MLRLLSITCGAVLLGTAPALAQASASERERHDDVPAANPLVLRVGGVLGVPVAESSDRFDPGGGFTIGLGIRPHPRIGVQLEYLHTYHDLEGDALDLTGLDGNQRLQHGVLSVSARPLRGDRFGLYVVAGGGIYHREVEVTQLATIGVGRYCDPWLLLCDAESVPAPEIMGAQSSTDFGLNAGVGVDLRLAAPVRLYLEARYHYVFGPSFRTPEGTRVAADAQYVPVVLGLAF